MDWVESPNDMVGIGRTWIARLPYGGRRSAGGLQDDCGSVRCTGARACPPGALTGYRCTL